MEIEESAKTSKELLANNTVTYTQRAANCRIPCLTLWTPHFILVPFSGTHLIRQEFNMNINEYQHMLRKYIIDGWINYVKSEDTLQDSNVNPNLSQHLPHNHQPNTSSQRVDEILFFCLLFMPATYFSVINIVKSQVCSLQEWSLFVMLHVICSVLYSHTHIYSIKEILMIWWLLFNPMRTASRLHKPKKNFWVYFLVMGSTVQYYLSLDLPTIFCFKFMIWDLQIVLQI